MWQTTNYSTDGESSECRSPNSATSSAVVRVAGKIEFHEKESVMRRIMMLGASAFVMAFVALAFAAQSRTMAAISDQEAATIQGGLCASLVKYQSCTTDTTACSDGSCYFQVEGPYDYHGRAIAQQAAGCTYNLNGQLYRCCGSSYTSNCAGS